MADLRLNESVRGKTDLRDKVSGESRGRYFVLHVVSIYRLGWFSTSRRVRAREGCADINFQAKKTIESNGRFMPGEY